MSMTTYRIAADIGGTFTDIACLSGDGILLTAKVPSTPHDYSEGILNGIRQIIERVDVPMSHFANLLHASTIATNTILESKGRRPRWSRPVVSGTCWNCGVSVYAAV